MFEPPASNVSQPKTWWVVCLCAAWCNTCTGYRATFDSIALEWPQVRFEWLDIEDEADIAGDLDVETFPTVLVADGKQVRFLGPVLPQAGVLSRLVTSLYATEAIEKQDDVQAQAVFENLRRSRSG